MLKRLNLLLVALLSVVAMASKDVGQMKLDKVRKMRDASSNGIIEFSPKEYQELVIANPRPYNMITLFSVRSGCDDCDLVFSELIGAAYSYRQVDEQLDVPTFFGVIYYSPKQEVKQIFD